MKQRNKEWIFLTLINHLASVIGTVICLYGIFKVSNTLTMICMIFLLIYNVTGLLEWLYEIFTNNPKKYEQLHKMDEGLGKLCHNKFLTNLTLVMITGFALFIKTLLPLSFI